MPDVQRPILIVLGFLCVGLAVLGIFLPVLPTTPLLLVALAGVLLIPLGIVLSTRSTESLQAPPSESR